MVGIKYLVYDIRFWILLTFILRLYHITNPPLEVAHNWRQTTVTMPARNFVEEGVHLFYPKVDFAGEKTGITGMEFPLLNYLIYLISMVFGYAHWYGRLITLTVSSFGLFYFYKLIQKYFNKDIAFNAAFLLLFSIWFSYSRKIMPDTFSMSFVIAGIYYGSEYLDSRATLKNLTLYFALVLIGILSKLPSGFVMALFVIFILDKKIPLQRRALFSMVSLTIVGLASAYYFYWVPRLNELFGFQHFFMGKSLAAGAVEIFSHYNKALEKFYAEALGYSGFLVCAGGLTVAMRKKEKLLLAPALICFLAFLLIIFKGGFAFYHHSYYIIPFAPVMALIAGYGLSTIRKKNINWIALTVVALECIFTNNADFYIKENNLALLKLEQHLDKVSTRSDLILINSDNVPTPMYFAHRRGWIKSNEEISMPGMIDTLKQKGLKFIVILKRSFGSDLPLNLQKVYDDPDVCIYRL